MPVGPISAPMDPGRPVRRQPYNTRLTMNRAECIKTLEALKRGEAVNLTPEQAADLFRFQVLEQVRAGVEAARNEPQPLTADALTRILCAYGGNNGVWALFTHIVIQCRLTPAAFASGLAHAYTVGRADRETALVCFNAADRRQMMGAAELAAFDALPERLTIFRGCSVDEHRAGVYGLSWTVSREIAEFFAWRFDAADRGRVVVSCEIPRADVLALFNPDTEQEIITDVHAPACSVEVVAWEPSALYWDYMKRKRQGGGLV